MATVRNSLTKGVKDFNNSMVQYDSGDTQVKLSPSIIRNYLVNGGGEVTDQEVVMFLNLCKAQRLNPFLKEAYLLKLGSRPATIVTGKEVFTKRARREKDFRGFQAGVIVLKHDGEVENRIGTLTLTNETLVGGWAKVFIDGYDVPIEITVALDEYIGVKKDGTVNSQWDKRPGTMIRKVALVQALREAFPEQLQGMYAQDEMDVEVRLDETPIEQKEEIEPTIVIESYNQIGDDPLAD